MKKGNLSIYIFIATIIGVFSLAGFSGKRRYINIDALSKSDLFPADSTEPDSTLPYPFNDGEGGLYMDQPSNYNEEVEYDPETGQYIVTPKIGNLQAKPPMFMTPEEYQEYVSQKQVQDYWKSKTQSAEAAAAEGRDPGSSLIPQIKVNSEVFEKIFGSNTIDIRPQGFAELSFGGRIQKIDNPIIPEQNRSTFNFNFDQRIQMNVTGNIGTKMRVLMNYDTEATFSFENQMKVDYTGDEDDIVKKIELGNVSLPLNSSLMSGAQSLFGVKGQFQFGKLMLTGVFSEQRSETSSINVQGGATTTDFEIWGDQYEANKHYFLAHYFRDNYESFLRNVPNNISPVQITKVEVWVTNTRQETQNTRNIVAFMDLGERDGDGAYRSTDANLPGANIFNRFSPYRGFPDNRNNGLNPEILERDYPGVRDVGSVNAALNAAGFQEAIEYSELSNARRLRPTEFTFHPQLGYISLSSSLNQDEVLAVAYQFTAGGKTFQVGEFSNDGVTPPKNLVVKMLKSTILSVSAPMWDLMMKNIYSLNAYQVNREDFKLEVLYRNDETGTPIPFLPDGNLKDDLLVRVMELDRLNNNNDPQPDGFFDFVPGTTINPQNGRIIFPVLEPFGSNLNRKLDNDASREKYVFQELYDSTRFKAQNETQLNKYLLRGSFKSTSSSEISLNALNVPEGSVTVTAGGVALVENQHYTVDYNLGRVRIIDEGILNSGTPIKVNFENNSLVNFQTKTFMGINGEYKFNPNLTVGGTLIRLSERPLTQKVNIGEEPISNSMFGFNVNYSKEAPYLTRMVDAIPFIETKAPSNISAQAEYAQLVPGSPKGIELDGDATTYLDDFESSQTIVNLNVIRSWRLASVPGGQPSLFPEGNIDGIESGYNRAKLAWYNIDPLFHASDNRTPDNIKDNPNLQSEQYTREVLVTEIFPNLEQDASQPRNISMFDLAFYPNERGPYNYSDNLTPEGALLNPENNWGGIMRDMTTTNFEEQNIEFIQVWMLNPFYDENNEIDMSASGGELYFNLGSVSEDVLKDGQQAIENGKPADGDLTKLDTTSWGYVSKVRPPVIAFDNDPSVKAIQDVGYDLLDDTEEKTFPLGGGLSYLQRIENKFGVNSVAYQIANADPAADNFGYYRSDALDDAKATIRERYKNYNNPQGNSNTEVVNGVSAFATNTPDIEDVNGDQTLSKTEAYYQYKVVITPQALANTGENYITDIKDSRSHTLPNDKQLNSKWIQIKIPVFRPEKTVGPISDFRSIRFMRMFVKGFEEDIVLRFAKLELVRGEWRRYAYDLSEFGDEIGTDNPDQTLFEVNAVNIEQNGSRTPIPYVLPPGISREVLFGTSSSQQQNEQSLSMRVCNLEDGDARAVFRNINFDMRMYNRMQMFAHLEGLDLTGNNVDPFLEDFPGVNLFIRMGSDYNQNFYEYEIPLKKTDFEAGSNDDDLIWPSDNDIDFALDDLKDVKLERDRAYREVAQSITEPYSATRGKGTITVVGAPNLGNVRTIMIGIRNPKERFEAGMPVCAEVWVNELRLTEFDQRGGWAANARVAAQFADFANISLSGRTSSVGFGGIDQKVSERQKEQIYAYDFQSSFQLGQFFPKDAGLRIPMFYGISEEWKNPQFNPLDPDIEMQDALDNLATEADRDTLKEIVQDYTRRKSINFTNVGKQRVGEKAQKKPQVYDIENFSVSYAFNETFRRNINTVADVRTDHTGSINYNFSTTPKPVEPFKRIGFLQSKYFALIRDFNFNYYPKSITAIATINRSLNEVQQRNTDNLSIELPITYNRTFNFNRQYSLLYDITKSLRFDFNAQMNTRIDELPDSTVGGKPFYTEEERRQKIWDGLYDFGRPTNYHQTVNVNWQVPVNLLPFMDFASVQASYKGDYDWLSGSLLSLEEDPLDPKGLNFGNTIQNNMQVQLNNSFNMNTLYNKVPYLKKVNQGPQGRKRRSPLSQRDSPLGNRGEDVDKEDEEEEDTGFEKVMAGMVKTLMMIKNASANFSKTEGTLLPGFLPQASLMGMDDRRGFYGAPGFGFTVGDQADIRRSAADQGWLTKSAALNTPYSKTYTETMTFRVTTEPAPDLRIVFNANKNTGSNSSEFYRFDTLLDVPDWSYQNLFTTSNYTVSFLSIATAFEKSEGPNYDSEAYTNFLNYRHDISQQLANDLVGDPLLPVGYNPNEFNPGSDSVSAGFPYYSYTSQDVMIPAFLAAYSGKSPDDFKNGYKMKVPLPNWQLTYDGLSKMKFVKQFLSGLTVNHSYRSTYSANGISTNLLRQQKIEEYDDRLPTDNSGDLLPEQQISSLVIAEQFAPLIGFNIKLKNSMTVRLEYKKSRNVTLGLTNAQITETKSTEWVVGTGYIIKDLRLTFIQMGNRRENPVSNLELKADLGIRDNITLIRRIVEDINQASAGQKVITMKFSADYQLSQRINSKVFYDLSLSKFKTSNAYPINTHQFGISFRLNLGR